MFYSELILSKKGPLAKVWIAAHNEKKLKKSQVVSTDLFSSVKAISSPTEPLALRLSAHLLLGVVRLLVKKAEYLNKDFSTTVIRIRMGPINSNNPLELGNPHLKENRQITFGIDKFQAEISLDNSNSHELQLRDIWENINPSDLSSNNDNTSKPADITKTSFTPRKVNRRSSLFGISMNSDFSLTGNDGIFFPTTSFNDNEEPITPSPRKTKRSRIGITGVVSPIPMEDSSISLTFNESFNGSIFGSKDLSGSGQIEQRRDGSRITEDNTPIGMKDRKESDIIQKENIDFEIDDRDTSFQPQISTFNESFDAFEAEQQNSVDIRPTFEEISALKKKPSKKKEAKVQKRKRGIKIQKTSVLSKSVLSNWKNDCSDITVSRIALGERLQTFQVATEYGFSDNMLENSIKESITKPYISGCAANLQEFCNKFFVSKSREDFSSFLTKYQDVETRRERDSNAPVDKLTTTPDRSKRGSEKMSPETGRSSGKFGSDFDVNVEFNNFEPNDFNDSNDFNFSEGNRESKQPSNVSATDKISSGLEEETATRLSDGQDSIELKQTLGDEGSFFKASKGMTRSKAAKLFHHLLVMKTKNEIEVEQEGPFEDILYHKLS